MGGNLSTLMRALAMTVEEREAFLAGPHVGVLAVARADGPPLAVPIWYGYEPGGDVWMLTDEDSLKGRLLRAAGRASLCAQSEKAPAYAYVSVEGPVTFAPSDRERHARPLAHRYLGRELGDRYFASTEGTEPALVTLRPERWFTVDYAKL
jgi:PPOX class probable F420-dependent enzyme